MANDDKLDNLDHPQVSVWDVTRAAGEVWQWAGHGDQVQAVSWSPGGATLATQSKDKMLRLFDPR